MIKITITEDPKNTDEDKRFEANFSQHPDYALRGFGKTREEALGNFIMMNTSTFNIQLLRGFK